MTAPARRRLLVMAVVLLIILGLTILFLPEVARRLAVDRLEQALTVPVQIDDVDLNLFTGRATVENIAIGASEPRPILVVPALTLEFSRLALLRGNADVHSITVENPSLLIERLDAATYNVLQAVRGNPEKQQTGEAKEFSTQGFAFSIRDLQIRSGEITFIDRTRKPDYRLTLSALDLSAGPISSLPGETQPTQFSAGVRIADGVVRMEGSSKLFDDSVQETELRAAIENIKLNEFGAYLPYGGRLELADSMLAGTLRYVLASQKGKVTKHVIEAALSIGAMELMSAEAERRRIAHVGEVTVNDVQLDLQQSRMRIGALIVKNPYLFVRRDGTGLNLAQLTPGDGEPPLAGAEEDTAMSLVIEKAEARSGTLEFVDETLAPPVHASIESLAMTANQIRVLPDLTTGDIAVQGQMGRGSMSLRGNLVAEPLQGKFSVSGKQLPFELLGGYLDQIFTDANFAGETFGAQLQLTLADEARNGVVTTLTGTLGGPNIGLHFADADDAFLTSDDVEVALGTLRFGAEPTVDIERIVLQGPRLELVRDRQGQINLARFWQESEGGQQAAEGRNETAKSSKGNAGSSIAIRSITVNQGNIRIRDLSVTPNYTTTVANLTGRVTDFAKSAKRAEVKLDGRLDDGARLSLDGWFTPFSEQARVELKANVTSYALPPLNPYATQYLSHRIRQGQMTTEIDYTLKGDELQANAGLVLRNLRLGEKTGDDFAQRIGIPLELAIALLQDVGGVIRLQIAMSSEGGANVDVSSLVWRAVRNAILKAITAPFRLVGNILTLGGRIGGVRIDPVAFEPGTSVLEPQGKKQLEQIAELLKEKPALQLRLSGQILHSELDNLRQRRFWERIENAQGKSYQEALLAVYRELGGITEPKLPLSAQEEESMEKFVMARLDVGGEEQSQLARTRAEIVERELQARGIDPGRLAVGVADSAVGGEKPVVQIDIVS